MDMGVLGKVNKKSTIANFVCIIKIAYSLILNF